MTICYSDTETYCETPIKHGAFKYAEKVEVMLWPYAFDEGAVSLWDKVGGQPMPSDLKEALRDPSVRFVWHNSGFDLTVIRNDPTLRIDLPIERCDDTMAIAYMHGLPGGLGILCDILGVPVDKAKDKRGRELINLFCKPRPKAQKIRRATRDTHPKEWQQFAHEYAPLDVVAMQEIYRRLPKWNYRHGELELWHLDARINARGFACDTELARCAIQAIEHAQTKLASDTSDATFGYVGSATQRDVLLGFILDAYGVQLPDMTADTLERRLEDPELPEGVKELIRIRLQASTSSTSKFKKLMDCVGSDGRLRGTAQFCGASRTGRDAHRLFQPGNMPRPSMKNKQIEQGIAAIKAGVADLMYDNVMEVASNAIRGCIVAPPGKKLVVADLSNIEGRKAAWLAGEEWKLQAFRDYDTCMGKDGKWHTADEIYSAARLGIYIDLERDKKGEPIRKGYDLYALSYANAFNITPEEVMENKKSGDGIMRQIGKVMELMLQYEGGVGAFITGAATYGIDLDKLAEVAWPNIPDRIKEEAEGLWSWAVKKDKTFGLAKKTYIVCDSLKHMWREAHPAISSYWGEMRSSAIHAVTNPGVSWPCRRLVFRRDGAWLRMGLPSGRALCYASPRYVDDKLTYKGINQYSRKWQNLGTYGGKLFENATQASARDVFKGTDMRPGANTTTYSRIEEEGYGILISIHDELVTEAPDTEDYNSDRLAALMVDAPLWADGLPLAAAGFEAARYRKE